MPVGTSRVHLCRLYSAPCVSTRGSEFGSTPMPRERLPCGSPAGLRAGWRDGDAPRLLAFPAAVRVAAGTPWLGGSRDVQPTRSGILSLSLPQIGCDRSRSLVDICGERRFQALVGDALALPLRSGSCDACLSVAVIHHLATAVSVASVSPELRLGAGRAPGWLRWTQSQLLRWPRPLPGGRPFAPFAEEVRGARAPARPGGRGDALSVPRASACGCPSVPGPGLRSSAVRRRRGAPWPRARPRLPDRCSPLLPTCLSSFFKTQVLRSLTHAFNSSQTFLVLKQVNLMFYIFLIRKNSLFFCVSGVSPLT